MPTAGTAGGTFAGQFSDGFFTRLAHDTHPVDLMCLYLLHGSVERIPGLLVDRETLSFKHLSQHVRTVNRSSYDDADTFSLCIKNKVRGRLYGLEFRIYFIAGEPYAETDPDAQHRLELREKT
ncbi:hypothetical protein ACFU7Y_31700 [Kitasatospora sp. NPDC057542]